MNKQLKSTSIKRLVSTALLVSVLLIQFIPISNVHGATQIVQRSLTLKAGVDNTTGSEPGATVNHLYTFTVPNDGGGVIKSIKFQYCLTAADVGANVCVMPTGLDTMVVGDAAHETGLLNATGAGSGGFSLDNSVSGTLRLNRAAETAIPANTPLTFEFKNIKNPTQTTPTILSQTFFVRITTYTSQDSLSGQTDLGTVAASTNNGIDLQGYMPESLVFCAGKTIPLTVSATPVPDCTAADDSEVRFNQLFSPTDTATATSQMSASTNAGTGYVITVNGPTLMSGTNSISAMTNMEQTLHGVSQFGLNLRANTNSTSTAAVGAEVTQPSNGTNFKGQALAGYNTVDRFKFNTAAGQNDVANSAYVDGVTQTQGGTDAQIFTVSYIVNVPGSQPAGSYTTTLTYICTPTF